MANIKLGWQVIILVFLTIALVAGCTLSGLESLKDSSDAPTTAQLSELEARLLVMERSQIDVEIVLGLHVQGIEDRPAEEDIQAMIGVGRRLNQAAMLRVMQGADPFAPGFWEELLEWLREKAAEDSGS